MGHFCRICGRSRPNEQFSGRGHRDHVCKDCQRMPHEKRDRIERLDELWGFLDQSHISETWIMAIRAGRCGTRWRSPRKRRRGRPARVIAGAVSPFVTVAWSARTRGQKLRIHDFAF